LNRVKSGIVREQLITEEDISAMIKSCINPRDKAFFDVHYEAGTRPGEILSLKIKNVKFDNFGAFINVDGKTVKDSTHFKIKSQFNQFKIVNVQATDQQGNPDDLQIGEIGFIKVNLESNKQISTLVTVNIFDADLTSIGIGSVKTSLSSGQSEIILSFMIPIDAAIGPADIYANAFSDWPSNGGIPLTSEFSISESIRNTTPKPEPPTPEPEPTLNSIVVATDKSSYSEDETILVTGKVRELFSGTPVSMAIRSSNGDTVALAQLTVGADKKFSAEITAGETMNTSGTYTVEVTHGTKNRIATTSFEFISDVTLPEPNQGITLTATANQGSEIIFVTGMTDQNTTDVTFRVTSPSGNNVVSIDQAIPDVGGNFVKEFRIGPAWEENGFYEITAMQGIGKNSLHTLKILVEVTNGMAEKTSVTTESNLETEDGKLEIFVVAIKGSTIIEVTGMTDRASQDITLTVNAPNGNVMTVNKISPKLDGEFTAEIIVGGSLWKQDGFYTVTVQQFDDPKYTASAEVDIKDGVVT